MQVVRWGYSSNMIDQSLIVSCNCYACSLSYFWLHKSNFQIKHCIKLYFGYLSMVRPDSQRAHYNHEIFIWIDISPSLSLYRVKSRGNFPWRCESLQHMAVGCCLCSPYSFTVSFLKVRRAYFCWKRWSLSQHWPSRCLGWLYLWSGPAVQWY